MKANAEPSIGAGGGPSREFLDLIDHDYARRHLILSTGRSGEVEHLAVAESTKPLAVFNVGVRLGRGVQITTAPAEEIAAAIDRTYAAHRRAGSDSPVAGSVSTSDGQSSEVPRVTVEGSQNLEADLEIALREAESDLLSTQGKAPTVRLVDLILFEALQRGASDVHIQPVRDQTLIRYRLDGSLHTVRELPGALAAGVTTRIKIMARLDVAEQRAPQDGRATVTIGGSVGSDAQAGRRIDLRVSTLPSTYGQRVVLRLLDPARSPHLLNFTALGMPAEIEKKFLAQVSKTSGIVLSTGPTGSGKTTTLYATLAWISATNGGELDPAGVSHPQGRMHASELNIMTVEDPVEYDLSGPGMSVSQTQVDSKKNLSFAAGLRHILRQDPDVIMVGEIRDEETARVAVQASLTGHLVLSTLHTNDAASAVARLIDLGVDPFLVNSSLSAVLAQRLVRRLHAECGGTGCPQCLNTGFKGRLGVFELLVLDGAKKELIAKGCSAFDLKALAQKMGMVTLREAGSELVRAGVTTEAEVARVIEALDEETADEVRA